MSVVGIGPLHQFGIVALDLLVQRVVLVGDGLVRGRGDLNVAHVQLAGDDVGNQALAILADQGNLALSLLDSLIEDSSFFFATNFYFVLLMNIWKW